LIGAALTGLGGAVLTVVQLKLFREGITSGRGWIAVALVIFARWRPSLALAGAMLFGLADSIQFRIQAVSQTDSGLGAIPYEFLLNAAVRIDLAGSAAARKTQRFAGAAIERSDQKAGDNPDHPITSFARFAERTPAMTSKFLERIQAGEKLVSDGATGPTCSSAGCRWKIGGKLGDGKPGWIVALARDFVEAGSDVILTCTFGASRLHLEHMELADKTEEINRTAVALAKKSAQGTAIGGRFDWTDRGNAPAVWHTVRGRRRSDLRRTGTLFN
jgi:hypothetical protein